MCQILKVDRSSYYKWLKRGKSKRQQYNEELLVLIRQEYIKSGCLYGSPRITAVLKKNNVACSDIIEVITNVLNFVWKKLLQFQMFNVYDAKSTGMISDLVKRLNQLEPADWAEATAGYKIER